MNRLMIFLKGYRLYFSTKVDICHCYFYIKTKELGYTFKSGTLTKEKLEKIAVRSLRAHDYSKRLTRVNILMQFKDNTKDRAFVNNKDCNTVTLNLKEVMIGIVGEQSSLEDKIAKILVHEITHIWQNKKGTDEIIYKKCERRMRRLDKKSLNNGLTAFLQDDFLNLDKKRYGNRILRIINDLYVMARNDIESKKERIISEATAEFIALSEGKEMTTDEIIRKGTTVAETKLNGFFGKPEAELSTLLGRLIIRLNARTIQEIRLLADKILKEDYDDDKDKYDILYYEVAPAIVATVYQETENGIEKIDGYSYLQLMKQYKTICKKKGIRQVISFDSSENAIVNFGRHIVNLNRIRREAIRRVKTIKF